MTARPSPTKKERKYIMRVADLGCCICQQSAEIHHITTGVGMGQRAGNYDILPLCHRHHRTGGHGVAIHAGKRTWEKKFGLETEHMDLTKTLLGVE